MGRKRSAEDRRRHAEENGFNDDDTDVDDNPVPRDVLDYTKERYDVQMELWSDLSQSGINTFQRYKKTHPEATPHKLKTLKHFAEFMAKSIKGVLDANGKPTVQTVRNYFRCFVSGWNIDNPKSLISRDHRDSITNYIKGPLKKKLGLSTATRPKTYLTLENYMYMERQLWQSDGHEYVHEAYRVFISAKLKCHVFTPSRLGEVSEGSTRRGTGKGLRYKQRPTHILYEFLPDQPLFVNPILFMLAIFLAAGAFKKYWVLEWADHVLDLPVFPEKIQTGTSFSTQLKELSLRAGMEVHVTVHSGRRETLIQATSNGYSKDELMKFAAHTNQMTLTRDYLSSITAVDGLASFLKLSLRSDQAEDFRSMTVRRNPELFLSLSAKKQDELRQRDDYIAITKKIEGLTLKINAATTQAVVHELRSQRSQLLEQRRMLKNKELNEVRHTQERIHPSDREGTFHVDQHRSRFDRLRHMMPERDQLLNTLFCVAPLRSAAGISALKDLIALLKDPCRVAYQPTLRPTQGRCPVPNCAEELELVPIDRRWKHVFDCSMAYHKGGNKVIEFCFICNRSHIDGHELPLRCDFIKFRRAIACTGRCMTCMHNKRLPAARRLYGFMKQASWQKHVNECYSLYVEKLGKVDMIPCPNPDCSISHMSEQESWYHLQDAHSYPPRSFRTKTEKKRDIFVDGGRASVERKRRRVHVEQENGSSEPPSAEAIKPGTESIWSTPTTPSPYSTNLETNSSGANTPLSSLFDVDTLQEDCPSATSISSPSLSLVDIENVGDNEYATYPSFLSCPSLSDDPGTLDLAGDRASQAEDTALSSICDNMFQTILDERRDGRPSDIRPPLSEISGLVNPADVSAPHGDQGAMDPMDLVDLELRPDTSSAEHMEGVATESLSGGQGGGDDGGAGRPAAIDEKEDIWEVEALLAKWKQGRRTFYLVKWMGFPDEVNSWEKRTDISAELVGKFDAAYLDYGGNHIGVELLDKRIKHGRVEYLVRWKGRPDIENS
ncbi:hypothetical protein QBC46DRAFT_365016 [Diplogelasinospora grovesii]|uniref:Chromo domain-containing protein n=1 Tax=Diplogelasinospora grovesii TaxID=303347 RepID=A0AAN6N5V5_9PEZI|nr:hypothetical protein QBC46DRAFT_365016 [Diplogelasinospora grovesii]